MRTVTYGAACSLDGFITGPDEAIDWLHFSADVRKVMTEYWAGIDTVLFGRRTWEMAVRQEAGAAPPTPGVRSYVFSRTIASLDRPGVELVRDDAAAFVRDLKSKPGKDICVLGGGVLATSLIDGGVVDEVRINIHPVLVGGGVRLFDATTRRVPLEFVEARPIAGGCVLASYRVATNGSSGRQRGKRR